MGFFGVLLLSLGALCIAAATECVPETAKCSVYWEKILPHKNLIASEDELDLWCSKQALFYKCLEDVLLEGKNGNLSYLPTNLLVSKLFSQDLCIDSSTNRKRLLSSADCINQLDTDFCVLPEYLDIVTSDDSIPSTRCSQAEKTFSCIAATMVLNCGFDAGRVYRTMLKITRYSDEVCGIETSEGIPPCEETYSKSRDDKLSEIYYGLFHRIGSVLDEESSEDEFTDSTVEEDLPENKDKIVTKVLRMTLDNLDENAIAEECDSPECLGLASDSRSVPCSDMGEYKPHMKNPAITEVFKELLFYNYSGHEYAAYWRQPDFNIFHSFECEHLQASYREGVIFQCKIKYRYEDPDCLSNATVYEKVTPEFIRSFDPEVSCDSEVEFGPRPEWMKDTEKMIRDKTKSTPASAVTDTPVILAMKCLFDVASTACSRKNLGKSYDSETFKMFRIFPDAIHDQMVDLFIPDQDNYELPPMNRIKVGDTTIILIYDHDLTKSIENMMCSRLDECNPRGRGLWKCKMWPRKISTCKTCGAKQTEDIKNQNIGYAEPSESYFQTLKITEPTVIVDGSGILEDSTLGESIAFVFSGENEAENLASVDPNAEDMGDFLSMDDETNSEDGYRLEETEVNESGTTKAEYNLVPDTEVEYKIMRIFDSGEASKSSEVAYEVDNTNAEDNSDILIATDAGGLLSGNFVLVKDMSDFNEPKYTIVSIESTDEAD